MVFGDEFRLKFTVPVSWDVNLEFPILALEGFGRMAVTLIGCGGIAFPILFITKGGIQFRFHKFLKDILEAVP